MLTLLNYPVDEAFLLAMFEKHKTEAQTYVDPRYQTGVEQWQILKMDQKYFSKIFEDLGVKGSPRFYYLPKFGTIPEHRDNGTLCSINFLLGDPNPAAIVIEGKEFFYRQAVLDTQKMHSVQNGPHDRILFKISIFDATYDQVVQSIRYRA